MLLSMSAQAEALWKGGDSWSVELPRRGVVLEYQFSTATTTISEKDYNLLFRKKTERDCGSELIYNDTIGYFRSEAEDSLIYAIPFGNSDSKEYLLFDLKNNIEYKNSDFWATDSIGIFGHIFTEVPQETPIVEEPEPQQPERTLPLWTNGTSWVVEYDENLTLEYYLTKLHGDQCLLIRNHISNIYNVVVHQDTLAFIRTECNDSLIYATRSNVPNAKEQLLYDFRKKYEYGDSIFYGVDSIGIIADYITPQSPDLTYYHDVIEPGDTLPAWKGLVYMVGHIRGPLALFGEDDLFLNGSSLADKEINRLTFSAPGNVKGEISTTKVEILRIDDSKKDSQTYNLNGSSGINLNGCTIFIHEGRKYMMLQRR